MRITLAFSDLPAGIDPGPRFRRIDTRRNRALAEAAWARGAADPNAALFPAAPDAAPVDAILRALAAIDDHHPGWTEILLLGLPATDAPIAALHAEGCRIAPGEGGLLLTG